MNHKEERAQTTQECAAARAPQEHLTHVARIDGQSLDLREQMIARLREVAPELFAEGKIDFDRLKLLLGKEDVEEDDDEGDDSPERYQFSWHGKRAAQRACLQERSYQTLLPAREESKDWDTTGNLYIEGDNLQVLQLLQKSYYGRVKMIYIDPPYNTGNDFVYKDDYRDSLGNYERQTKQRGEDGKSRTTNKETDGRYHTHWLNMIYPRLRLARTLLSQDGVIFISIDDHEVHNLRKVCDEIFGASNFITQFVRKGSGGRQDSTHFAIVHEYVLCYAKKFKLFVAGKEQKKELSFNRYDKKKDLPYKLQLLRKWGDNSKREDRPNLYYPITAPDGSDVYPMLSQSECGCWRWGKETMRDALQKEEIEFKRTDSGEWIPYQRVYQNAASDYKLFSTWIDNIDNSTGKKVLDDLFEKISPFDYPKPTDLIGKLINMGCPNKDSIVLDFFSGSATTAHAVMQLNAEDGGNRKFIMVQLPEETPANSAAREAGYETLCAIGKERIRRAGAKIEAEWKAKQAEKRSENPLFEEEPSASPAPAKLDTGFRVFKLDSSNLKAWQDPLAGTPGLTPKEQTAHIQKALDNTVDNIVDERSHEDLLYEFILKLGLPLSTKMTCLKPPTGAQADYSLYVEDAGGLFVCIGKDIDLSATELMIKCYQEKAPEVCYMAVHDAGFADDQQKTNFFETLKCFASTLDPARRPTLLTI